VLDGAYILGSGYAQQDRLLQTFLDNDSDAVM
jgi:hypothetical protein